MNIIFRFILLPVVCLALATLSLKVVAAPGSSFLLFEYYFSFYIASSCRRILQSTNNWSRSLCIISVSPHRALRCFPRSYSNLSPVRSVNGSPRNDQSLARRGIIRYSSVPLVQPALQDHQNRAVQLFTSGAGSLTPYDANFILSPDSLFQALSVLLSGATGDTLAALSQYLGHAGDSPSVTGAATGLVDTYQTATYVLLSHNFQLIDGFQEAQMLPMNAVLCSDINFGDSLSLQLVASNINQQVSNLSNNVITNFCNPQNWSPDTALHILSAIYFNGLWTDPFSVGAGAFTLANGQDIHITNMLRTLASQAQYSAEAGWQAIAVPYAGEHEMAFILPPQGQIPSQITPELLANLFLSLSHQGVILSVPAFNINSEVQLQGVLTQAGLGMLFQPDRVMLGRMVQGSTPFSIDVFTQRNSLNVNARGTEAASVTEISLVPRGSSQPPRVHFNRPFLYVLRNKHSGRIVYIGQIFYPEPESE